MTLVLAACGSSDDSSSAATDPQAEESEVTTAPSEPEEESATSDAPAGPEGPYTSPDGRLTIDAPADGTVITIAEIAESIDLPEGVETLATYEFGPDGATFDPPLAVEVELDADMDTDGIAVIHVRSDGPSEPVDFEFTATGVTFELSSFSSVHLAVLPGLGTEVVLAVPDRVPVPEVVPIEPSIGLVFDDPLDRNVYVEKISASEPIVQHEDSQFYCDSIGTGTLSIGGKVTVIVDGVIFRFKRVVADTEVECYMAETTLAIEPPDSPDAEPLDFEVVARTPFGIAVPTAAIPQGGWIGLGIEIGNTVAECAIADGRGQDPPKSGCTIFGPGGSGTNQPIETTIEGEFTWLEMPSDSYQVADGTLQWVVDGVAQPVTFVNLDVFADGSRKRGVISIDQLTEVLEGADPKD